MISSDDEKLNEFSKLISDISYLLGKNTNLSDDRRIELSLKLLAAVSNLSMGDAVKQQKLFDEAEKINLHILRPTFYSPIPTISELKDDLWNKKENIGLDWNEEKSILLLKSLKKFTSEYEDIISLKKFDDANPAFVNHDAAVYYCMIRYLNPKRIIEIGSGYSTVLAVLAKEKNSCTHLTCIEPYPIDILKKESKKIDELIIQPVQEIPLSKFQELEENDILFIDSSHVSKIGSDVNYLFLEILPQLKPGVIIHIHDIFLPFPWPKDWTKELHLFWNEQYLLHAFLIGNKNFEILLGNYYFHKYNQKALKDFYDHDPAGGGSFWIKKIN